MEACHRGKGEKVASFALQEEREKSEPLLMGRNTGGVKQAEKLQNMRNSQAISTRTLWDSTGPDCPVLPSGPRASTGALTWLALCGPVVHTGFTLLLLSESSDFPTGKELILPHNHTSNRLTSGIMPPLNLFFSATCVALALPEKKKFFFST